ncbi:MAG TPA: hypothetical protein ENF74_05295 [Firmicutes bacterium]|nr:hypothetical protein [Bacillota bacterium]
MWTVVILGLLGTTYGQWTTYVSQREVRDLLTVRGKIWAATSGGLFVWDPEDSTLVPYFDFGRVQGPEVLSLARDERGRFWLGTAQDGLICWSPKEGVLEVFPVFAEDRVQALCICGDSLFVGTAHNGVCLFSVRDGEVLECYRRLGRFSRGAQVRSLYMSEDTLFVGTDEGIAWAWVGAPNLYDPESWCSASRSEDGYIIGPVNSIAGEGKEIFLCSEWGAFGKVGDGWRKELMGVQAYDVAVRGDTLAVATKDGIYLRTKDGEWTVEEVEGWVPSSLSFAGEGLWVYLSSGYAMVKDHMLYLLNRRLRVPIVLGPPGDRFTDLAVDRRGVLWAATSVRDLSPGGLYRFDGESWSRYAWGDIYRDAVTCVEVDHEGFIWAGTWGRGAFRLKDDGTPDVEADSVVWITPENSPLSPTVSEDFCVVADLAVDDMGRIWVANYMAHGSPVPTNTPIVVLCGFPHGDAVAFTDEDGVPDGEGTALLPLEGRLWFGTFRMGLAFLDYGPSLEDKGDDRWVHIFTAKFPKLTSNDISEVDVTPDGRILVATEEGLNVFRPVYSEGELRFEGWRVYDVSDGLPSNLVHSVCPTPEGSIWVGTEGGLARIRGDSITVYTRSNSPLVDNTVYALEYDAGRGCLWIGTGHGLSRLQISLTSEVSAPRVVASPNPFFPEEGRLTFHNLPEGSSLRIFSLSGELVRSLSPEGSGEVTWDGDNDAGYLVGSGVYLYVVKDPQGKVQVGKVALVRRRR